MTFRPSFTFSPLMVRQIVAIERTNGFLQAIRLQEDWIKAVRRNIQAEDALASVQIEGSSITLERAFELAKYLVTCPDTRLSDPEREFLNYLQTFDAIEGLHNDRDAVLSKGDLLNIHQSLVQGVRGSHRMAGQLRREQVEVGDIQGSEKTIHHSPPPWATVESEIKDLLDWVEKAKQKRKDLGTDDPWIHPAIVAAVTQHRLVWIHPFLDGNGRTARMFTTLILYQRGYDFKYLFNLSEYYNLDRDRYYDTLRTVDRTGDYTPWLEYFLGGLANQMVRVEERARSAVTS